MPTFEIPCGVYARLAPLTDTVYDDGSPWCRTMRIEDGKAITTNRKIMAIEYIGGPVGSAHIVIDPALIAQCKSEAQFNSVLTVTVDHSMRFATAKTTFGYVYPGNAGYWGAPDIHNELERWRPIIPLGAAKATRGGMFWDARVIGPLGISSPTGNLVFPEFIDTSLPVVIRDAMDDRWCGLFMPRDSTIQAPPATVPEWLVKR